MRYQVGPGVDDDRNNRADEAVIARAFRRSLVVLAVLATIALAAGLWLKREPPPPEQRSALAEQPMAAPQNSGIALPELNFTDITTAAGVNFMHVSGAYGERLLPETMGGGVAFLDYDDDEDEWEPVHSWQRWEIQGSRDKKRRPEKLRLVDPSGALIGIVPAIKAYKTNVLTHLHN